MIDKHPAAIAYCVDEADVVAAIGFARERGLRIAVRCGGHNGAGLGSVDDGLIIDLSSMNDVTVDPAARTVRAQGGALLQDVDRATHEHGFAVPAGIISTTGVGGLTLGGGVGHLSRGGGLTIDNLVAATVVLADGSIVQTDAEHEPDLFWAIRGGGGNFGVVTSFSFRGYPSRPCRRGRCSTTSATQPSSSPGIATSCPRSRTRCPASSRFSESRPARRSRRSCISAMCAASSGATQARTIRRR